MSICREVRLGTAVGSGAGALDLEALKAQRLGGVDAARGGSFNCEVRTAPPPFVAASAGWGGARRDSLHELLATKVPPKDAVTAYGSDAQEPEESEYSIPNSDIDGLLGYCDALKREGMWLTEATYIVNDFRWWGIPMKHHGFVLRAQGGSGVLCEYISLDFSRRGILWDTYDEYPELPDDTRFAKTYKISTDPMLLKSYCENTKPFSWPSNDCANWAHGLLKLLRINGDPLLTKDVDAQGQVRSECRQVLQVETRARSPIRVLEGYCWAAAA